MDQEKQYTEREALYEELFALRQEVLDLVVGLLLDPVVDRRARRLGIARSRP